MVEIKAKKLQYYLLASLGDNVVATKASIIMRGHNDTRVMIRKSICENNNSLGGRKMTRTMVSLFSINRAFKSELVVSGDTEATTSGLSTY